MDFGEALERVDKIVLSHLGRSLRSPEQAILEGAWQGLTYEQIAATSDYSTNYLMRDVAPKLWKFLSDALGTSVGKTNFRSVLGSEIPLSELTAAVPGPAGEAAGYAEELATLEQWIQQRCRLLSIYGLSGMGKTVLAQRLVQRVSAQFEQVIWYASVPPLQQLVEQLTNQPASESAASQSELQDSVATALSQRAYLIVFDAVESILQPGKEGRYQAEYANYAQLLLRLGERPHQSCLVMTGLENPPELLRLSGRNPLVKTLPLKGLSAAAAAAVLEAEQLCDRPHWETLIHSYQGNPAALRIASQMIRELFNGSVAAFLAQQSFIFGDINLLLQPAFEGVSSLERDILFWLAGRREPVSLATLQAEIPLVVNTTEMLETLESLIQRSLLETMLESSRASEGFLLFLPPLIKAYVMHQFIAQVCGSSAAASRSVPQALGPIIELGTPATKVVQLQQWFHNRFEPSWQPVELLFEDSVQPVLRLRSAYYLRDETLIKRFKSIKLANAAESVTVALLVAVGQMENQTYQICVQVQPPRQATVLPAGLQLRLLDGQSTVLAEIEAQAQDSFIQLPYFRGAAEEAFSLEIAADRAVHTEQFVI
ncbi:MAG: DUF1822 family protein [Leptolyngbya sp. SIO4C1]|nr:DUF1822 family protein [Leptolyngbya sp. SIO4C1]